MTVSQRSREIIVILRSNGWNDLQLQELSLLELKSEEADSIEDLQEEIFPEEDQEAVQEAAREKDQEGSREETDPDLRTMEIPGSRDQARIHGPGQCVTGVTICNSSPRMPAAGSGCSAPDRRGLATGPLFLLGDWACGRLARADSGTADLVSSLRAESSVGFDLASRVSIE